MTESEWLACTGTPAAMLRALRSRLGDTTPRTRRKLRLFTAAAARRTLALAGQRLRPGWAADFDRLLGLAELTADRADSRRQREEKAGLLDRLARSRTGLNFGDANDFRHALTALAQRNGWPDAQAVLNAGYWLSGRGWEDEAEYLAGRCDLVREVFGNPFRVLPTCCFPPHVVGLAAAVYAALPGPCPELPILADALEEAGEGEAASHLRAPGHVKGCHVLDRILGR